MKGGCGTGFIVMRWWSFWHTAFWCGCVAASIAAEAARPGFFPQCHWSQTIPATRRRVLAWLAVEVIGWIVHTTHLPDLTHWREQQLQC